MNKNVEKIIAGVVLVTAVAVPSSLAVKQKEINEKIVAEHQKNINNYENIIEQHQAETSRLLKAVEEAQAEIDSKNKQIQELESENKSLEGVRSNIISNVGYFPNTYERELLERLVECEAGAESLTGKIAVANVVLNRVKSEKFPNSISNVIYQKNQFEPAITGILNNKIPSAESKEAVKRALIGEKVVGSDILYFWASWLDRSNSIWNHIDIVQTIGVHHFGEDWK